VAWYCNLGYGLAEKRQGEGIMREALELAIDYAFKHMNLHRLQANYMPHNRRSGGLLRRLGFTVEGYARDYLFLNGAWEDHVLTSLTNPAWLPARGN
jgi:ribosomal-protein-alanine N-acetyltransferase